MQAGTAVGNLAGVIGVHPEEAAVIEQLQAGSEEAFAWLISRYQQPLYSLIYRVLPNPGDAADITQEVFVKVFRGIGRFHGEASLRTWIYRIALHEALNQRRWWSRHQRQELALDAESDDQHAAPMESLIDPQESPFDAAAHAEVAARVEAALREVPEPFRTVVVLRDIEGFGYEEIAEILNANLGTVKSRLMRGRAHLKSRLTPYVEAANRRRSPSSVASLPPACSTEEAV
ncbi:MAG TPA: sigma-70 family RNA polymerase sigma factor [Acidobacteriaceae bacterium]|jgi:RNA polymerase sigma-70 factor (ECF subfamily)|nr:sigma-70 family RNA polymerase sigma factor [Acidobacteriaceae bacterium]